METLFYISFFFQDQDFEKIFKIKADFDTVTKNDDANVYQYACFVKRLCEREKLLPFDQSGIEGVIEYAVRLTERKINCLPISINW